MKLERIFWPNEQCFSFNLSYGSNEKCMCVRFDLNGGYLDYTCAEILATHMFSGLLYPDKVVELFGDFDILDTWESTLSGAGIKVIPFTKKEIKRLTKIVKEWWEKGISNCKKNLKEAELNDWLKNEFTIWSNKEI